MGAGRGADARTLLKWDGKPAIHSACGAIAQLGERIVRNDEVVGSSPTSSTKFWLNVSNSFNRAAFGLYNFCTTESFQPAQHLS
jgi:hypothetical protein